MKTLLQAIQEGQRRYKNTDTSNPELIYSEAQMIRFAIAEYLWAEFENTNLEDPLAVMDSLMKVTR